MSGTRVRSYEEKSGTRVSYATARKVGDHLVMHVQTSTDPALRGGGGGGGGGNSSSSSNNDNSNSNSNSNGNGGEERRGSTKRASSGGVSSSRSGDPALHTIVNMWLAEAEAEAHSRIAPAFAPFYTRFTDAALESEFGINRAEQYRFVYFVFLLFGLIYDLMWIQYALSLGEDGLYRFYGSTFGVTLIICAVSVWMNHDFYVRNFTQIHAALLLLFNICLIAQRYGAFRNLPATESLYLNLIYVTVLRGDFFNSLCITVITNVALFLMVIVTSDMIVVYRVSTSMFLGSLLCLITAYNADIQDRNVFLMRKKLIKFQEQSKEAQHNINRILCSIFPRTVVKSLIRKVQSSMINFSSERSCVMIISFSVDMFVSLKHSPESISQIEEIYTCIISIIEKHQLDRIKLRAGRIVVCEGLFQESTNGRKCAKAALEIMNATNKWTKGDVQKFSICIAIGSGYLEGGIIQCKKRSFEIMGTGFANAQSCLDCAEEGEIVMDDSVKRCVESEFSVDYKQSGNQYLRMWNLRAREKSRRLSLDIEMIGKKRSILGDPSREYRGEVVGHEIQRLSKSHPLLKYIGDFRFIDATVEQQYQRSLYSEDNWQVTRYVMFILTSSAIAAGVTDWTLYADAGIVIQFLPEFFICFRYVFVVPVLVLCCIPYIPQSSKYCRADYSGLNLWTLPYFAGLLYLLFLLVRTVFVFLDKQYLNNTSLWTIYYFYAETFDWIAFAVSTATIAPIWFVVPLVLWFGCGAVLNIFYHNVIGPTGLADALFYILRTYSVHLFLGWMSLVARDYTSRQEFLFQQVTSRSIVDINAEKNEAQEVLLSVITEDSFKKIEQDTKDLLETSESCILIHIGIDGSKLNRPDLRASDRFGIYSRMFQKVEQISELFDIQMVKTDQNKCVLISKNNGMSCTKHAEVALNFVFEAHSRLEVLYKDMMDENLRIQSGLVVGNCLTGTNQFVYDLIGDIVTESEYLCEVCPGGKVLVSTSLSDHLANNSLYELSIYHDSQRTGICGYLVEETKSIWSLFLKEADWMNQEAEYTTVEAYVR